METKRRRSIDPADDDFGLLCNCAVRYACGRQTYAPHTVVDFLTPLLPKLNNRTLACLDQDLTDQKYEPFSDPYGDPQIDEPVWLRFLALVRAERVKRGEEPYMNWREKAQAQSNG